jgi:anthranilate synthase component 1
MCRQFDGPRTPPRFPPSEPLAAYVAPKSILVFDHLTRRAALIHAGPESERQAIRSDIISALQGPVPKRPTSSAHEPPTLSLNREEFERRVLEAKERIADGDVFQVVLSICFEGACDVPPFEVYRALRLLNPSPYLYFLDFDDVKVVGSSPEALVRLDGRKASLRPIAGTRPRSQDPDEDDALEKELVEDPKEQAEHIMLVDLARNDLGRIAVPGSIEVSPFKIVERYSHVMHIVSGVNGILKPEADAFDLFAASFPAGTVSGAPKISAMEIVESMETQPRGIYAGTVGYFGHGGSMDQAIAIRTLTFQNGRYAYQAGAGIVADSIPEKEYEEVLAKSAALEAALTNAEQGL